MGINAMLSTQKLLDRKQGFTAEETVGKYFKSMFEVVLFIVVDFFFLNLKRN